jgi:hypothetical protein
MSDILEYRCAHCESEDLIRHCPSDCGWARCKDCNLVTDLSRTRDTS